MVNIREKVFLVVGLDFNQRRLIIENIKKKFSYIPSGEKNKINSINVLTLYGKEIDLDSFKEKIFTFSFSKEKIVILKDAYNLSKEIRDFIFKNFNKIILHNYIIFDIERDYYRLTQDRKVISDSFFSFIFKNAALFKVVSRSSEVSFEDLKKSIRKNDLPSSLYILRKLFEDKNKDNELGPQILGFLVRE
jgi:hypothetical protein